jgi:hypothetical protein
MAAPAQNAFTHFFISFWRLCAGLMLSALAKLRRGSEHKGVVHKSMGSNFQLCRGVFMRQAGLGWAWN